MAKAADRQQQRRPWLAFGVAAWKKFGDDQAGNLAGLIAYYAFISIFPLLLVLVTVLDLVLSNDPQLRQQLYHSALSQYPQVGELLTHKPALHQTGVALAIGLIVTFFGARGVAGAMQNAMNSVWAVPFADRPGFPWTLLRSAALIVVVGVGEMITFFLSGLAGGTGHVITGPGAWVAAVAVSLALNVGVFWLAFRLATARVVATRELRLGAFIAAAAWQLLQLLGGYLIAHQLAHSRSLYGTFGIVLGLLAWLYLQAQITLYAVEMNVVRGRRLWPRSMFPPPLTPQDMRAYRMYAQAEQRRPEVDVDVRVPGEDVRVPGHPRGGRADRTGSGN